MDKTISILMPAFNERQNVGITVRKCAETLKKLRISGEVIVTNDGSTDGTREVLENLKKEISNLIIINHQTNLGYGAALYDAIKASKGDLVVTIDSDGQFDIAELPLLLGLYEKGNKVVTGFRKEKKDSFMKVFANKCLVLLTNLMFGLNLKDANTAFKLFEGSLIRGLKIESRGYQTPTEIMVKLKTLGYEIAEVGITHSFREKGKSALGIIKTTYAMFSFLHYLRLKVKLFKKKIINSL